MSDWLKAAVVAGITAGTVISTTAIPTGTAGHASVTSGPDGRCVVLRIAQP